MVLGFKNTDLYNVRSFS